MRVRSTWRRLFFVGEFCELCKHMDIFLSRDEALRLFTAASDTCCFLRACPVCGVTFTMGGSR